MLCVYTHTYYAAHNRAPERMADDHGGRYAMSVNAG
jgi:hypothetical protein